MGGVRFHSTKSSPVDQRMCGKSLDNRRAFRELTPSDQLVLMRSLTGQNFARSVENRYWERYSPRGL